MSRALYDVALAAGGDSNPPPDPSLDVHDALAVDRFLGDMTGPDRLRRRTGAYYTGHDITAQICANTLIPRWLDRVGVACPEALAQARPWDLLTASPERYLHPAMGHGAGLPLPAEIDAGLADVSLREGWNAPASSDLALPTELWREVVARRLRRERLMARMGAGELRCVDDLVTENLNLSRYALDLIARCDSPALLLAMWRALLGLRVLDPTCGAGAFLLAALQTLERLFLACLGRMEAMSEAGDEDSQALSEILRQADAAPSRSFFIRRTLLAHNLYGVDLRPEAVEACRMRLCLALLEGVPPSPEPPALPDLRAHLVVGDALRDAPPGPEGGFDVLVGNPPYVEVSALASETRTRPSAEEMQGYATRRCGNLYALVIERSLGLLAQGGRLGMIVPLSMVCTDRMRPLQELLLCESQRLWFANYDDRPARLFPELEHMRATIVLLTKGQATRPRVHTSGYQRWRAPYRPYLFQTLSYQEATEHLMPGAIPKLGHPLAVGILEKMARLSPLERALSASAGDATLYYHNAPQYWVRATDFRPYFWNQRDGQGLSRQVKPLRVRDPGDTLPILALLNSSLFYWWFILCSDGRHLNLREIRRYPAGLEGLSAQDREALSLAATRLMADLRRHARRKEARYRTTGLVRYDEFHMRHSKPIIDEIDALLADHYGLNDNERDYVVNYDIKFRMGLSGGG